MHRYDEFEKLYYKRVLFKYLIFISIIILFLLGFFILYKKEKLKKIIKHNIVHKEIKKEKIKKNIVKKIKEKNSKESKSVKNFHFILPNLSKTVLNQKTLQKNKNDNSMYKKGLLPTTNNHKKNKIKEVKTNHIVNINSVKIVEKTPDLKTLIKKFNKTKNFDLAILISKIYLQKKDLQNAQIWALKANNINPSSYKSWILFADILLKKKKLKKVREILKVYIDSYGPNDIIEEKLRSLNDK